MEKMTSFFSKRSDAYDTHMLTNVPGCKEGYDLMSTLVPKSCKTLLDLGCGTGLELESIFHAIPDMEVTGIDLTQEMLNQLKQKYTDKSIKLICGSYFDVPFDRSTYDCDISFQTLHHFSHDLKTSLYRKIHQALTSNGIYIECDYMVEHQDEEDFYYAENLRIRKALGISDTAFYHYDTPCTVENQITLLKNSGFIDVETVFRIENTTMLVAHKNGAIL